MGLGTSWATGSWATGAWASGTWADLTPAAPEAAGIYEDYTTFTEADPSSHITVVPVVITMASMVTTEEVCIWKDYGAGYFSGDFHHEFTFNPSSFTSTGAPTPTGPYVCIWGVSDTASQTQATAQSMSCQTLAVVWDQAANGFYIMEQSGLPTTMSFDYLDLTLTAGTEYTYKVSRDESVGNYGTLYLELFTNPTDTTAAYSVSLALSQKYDYRYLYQLSAGYPLVSGTLNGTIEHLYIKMDPDFLAVTVSAAREILNELDEGFWTNEELRRWAYDAVVDIAIRSGCVASTASISTSDGTRSYAFTGYDCRYAVYSNVGLREMIPKQDGHDDFRSGVPDKWWQRKGEIGIEPLPDDAYTVNLYTTIAPSDWTGGFQAVPIRYEFRNLILLYVLTRAYMKDGRNEAAAKVYDTYINDLRDLTTIYVEEHIDSRKDYATPKLVVVKEQEVQNAETPKG